MTCKDCLHFDVCYMIEHYGADIHEENAENDCHQFKDSSNYVVREKGEWVLTDARFAEMSCSLCGFTYYGEYDKECMSDFCPQCGSDMRGDGV